MCRIIPIYLSHELRTPLTSIKEGTNLFLEGHGGPVTEKQKWLLTIVAEESNRLIELVSSLMDLSKLEAGMLAYHFTKAEIPHLVTMAAGEVLPLAEAKKIRIGTDIDAVPPVTLDEERIMQVLRNLIGNALKFTPPGGAVRIAVRSGADGVGVSVTDSGPGIPKEQQTAIFDKYRQATLAGTKKIPGTGLGLAIARRESRSLRPVKLSSLSCRSLGRFSSVIMRTQFMVAVISLSMLTFSPMSVCHSCRAWAGR